jgi:hypothetical protein
VRWAARTSGGFIAITVGGSARSHRFSLQDRSLSYEGRTDTGRQEIKIRRAAVWKSTRGEIGHFGYSKQFFRLRILQESKIEKLFHSQLDHFSDVI